LGGGGGRGKNRKGEGKKEKGGGLNFSIKGGKIILLQLNRGRRGGIAKKKKGGSPSP